MIKQKFASFLRVIRNHIVKMSDAIESVLPTVGQDGRATEKRVHDGEGDSDNKKLKTEGSDPATGKTRLVRRKMAMFMVYSGKGYLGMQRNPGARTIEGDLNEAMLKAGVATEEHFSNSMNSGQKNYFQRAARTDKGVSAAGQLCSLLIDTSIENPAEKINENLADQIRVLGIQRVTKKFDSKIAADARTYKYMMPTFAFTPVEDFVAQKFRITDDISQKVNDTLKLFVGTKNFHNFTSGKKSNDPSAKRYIVSFEMSKPFLRKDLEFAVITIKGQSFMLHQIRKMIGLTIAIVRGLAGTDSLELSFGSEKCDVPKAPGLGLMLDRVHYDYYNRRFGSDGIHEPILWEKYTTEIEKFKEEFIYPTIIDTELEEKSMLKWLGSLHLHNFGLIEDISGQRRAHLKLSYMDSHPKKSESEEKQVEPSDDSEVTSYGLEKLPKMEDKSPDTYVQDDKQCVAPTQTSVKVEQHPDSCCDNSGELEKNNISQTADNDMLDRKTPVKASDETLEHSVKS